MPLSLTHPYPLGLELGGPAWNELVARHLGYLPQPSVTEPPPPPWLLKHRKGLPAGYRRQAGAKVLLQIWSGFHKFRHIYMYIYIILIAPKRHTRLQKFLSFRSNCLLWWGCYWPHAQFARALLAGITRSRLPRRGRRAGLWEAIESQNLIIYASNKSNATYLSYN